LTVIIVESEVASPLHDVNKYREVFAVTFDGLVAATVTVEFGEYHPLGVVVPPFAFTVSKYCVL
jgi:hypothetical protein